jgi:DNA-binding CsgD family transcriptional regulator
LSRLVAGRALAAAGDREHAVAELQRAAAALDACGARGYREQAERLLRRLSRRNQRRPRTNGYGPAALTRRELEIAELVGAGRTNREVAAELFLSQKTVETHLRHIFAKLCISSRAWRARISGPRPGSRAPDAAGPAGSPRWDARGPASAWTEVVDQLAGVIVLPALGHAALGVLLVQAHQQIRQLAADHLGADQLR